MVIPSSRASGSARSHAPTHRYSRLVLSLARPEVRPRDVSGLSLTADCHIRNRAFEPNFMEVQLKMERKHALVVKVYQTHEHGKHPKK